MLDEWTEINVLPQSEGYDSSGINNLSKFMPHWGRSGLHLSMWNEFGGWNFSSSLHEKRWTLEEFIFAWSLSCSSLLAEGQALHAWKLTQGSISRSGGPRLIGPQWQLSHRAPLSLTSFLKPGDFLSISNVKTFLESTS